MERKFSFASGEYYHLYNRGTEKRAIFLDHGDYLRFLVLLHTANSHQVVHLSDYGQGQGRAGLSITNLWSRSFGEKFANIGAYCLMPNHFHLLVREKAENGIPKFMKKLLTSYSMYFNKKYVRTGQLFESTFKATYVGNDTYLKYLFAYIHLNPVKINDPNSWESKIIPRPETAKEFLVHYEYSSYPFYSGCQRLSDSILTPRMFPDYFSAEREFSDFIDDWINLYSD